MGGGGGNNEKKITWGRNIVLVQSRMLYALPSLGMLYLQWRGAGGGVDVPGRSGEEEM